MGRFTEWAKKKVAQDKQIKLAGGELIQAQNKEPAIVAGMFDYPEWEEGKVYNQYDLFTYNGVPGFVRQAHNLHGFHFLLAQKHCTVQDRLLMYMVCILMYIICAVKLEWS